MFAFSPSLVVTFLNGSCCALIVLILTISQPPIPGSLRFDLHTIGAVQFGKLFSQIFHNLLFYLGGTLIWYVAYAAMANDLLRYNASLRSGTLYGDNGEGGSTPSLQYKLFYVVGFDRLHSEGGLKCVDIEFQFGIEFFFISSYVPHSIVKLYSGGEEKTES